MITKPLVYLAIHGARSYVAAAPVEARGLYGPFLIDLPVLLICFLTAADPQLGGLTGGLGSVAPSLPSVPGVGSPSIPGTGSLPLPGTGSLPVVGSGSLPVPGVGAGSVPSVPGVSSLPA